MSMKEIFAVSLLIGCTIVSLRTDYKSGDRIIPPTFTSWGRHGIAEWCPHGTFAQKFGLKIESHQGLGDDTALNGIKLYCK